MATMNVSLPDPMKAWVEAQLKDGSFSNTSDYVRHLIRRDQERAQAIEALQHAINEGVQSGACCSATNKVRISSRLSRYRRARTVQLQGVQGTDAGATCSQVVLLPTD